MANEVTYTGFGGNYRAAEIFSRELHENLVDMISMRSLILKAGDLGGSGSDTLVVPNVTSDEVMAAANTSEVDGASNSAVANNTHLSLSVAKQIIQLQITDKMIVTGAPGMMDIAYLARLAANAYLLRFTDQLTALFPSITASASPGSGNPMDLDTLYDALATYEQALNDEVPFLALYMKQWTDLRDDSRGELGAYHIRPDAQNALGVKPGNFKGNLLGVDIITSDSVTAVNGSADSSGCLFSPSAFHYAEASLRGTIPGMVAAAVAADAVVYAEYVRTGNPGLLAIVGHAFNAVGIRENARAVEVISDR